MGTWDNKNNERVHCKTSNVRQAFPVRTVCTLTVRDINMSIMMFPIDDNRKARACEQAHVKYERPKCR